jgi:hypothetical protein
MPEKKAAIVVDYLESADIGCMRILSNGLEARKYQVEKIDRQLVCDGYPSAFDFDVVCVPVNMSGYEGDVSGFEYAKMLKDMNSLMITIVYGYVMDGPKEAIFRKVINATKSGSPPDLFFDVLDESNRELVTMQWKSSLDMLDL